MTLLVNGKPREVPADTTVADLLAGLDLTGKGVAVAVNRTVIPRSLYARHALQPDDEVEIIRAVGGG